ncbi:MAG: hypothetical protein MSIBF_00740 [Candidatus Altiarchaeales archaeon IMC4]|nr:MAG: hypothetical protein MSIBF_00740 [Candidatus Altiarchaeales archaeon IMC4]
MKILCIADIHGDAAAAKNAARFAQENKIGRIIVAGDFCVYGIGDGERLVQAKEMLEVLGHVLAIPGNCDCRNLVEFLDESGMNLHRKVMNLGGMDFAGFGGSSPTPFNSPIVFSEEEIYKNLRQLMETAGKGAIMICHVPPYGTKCDKTNFGTHVGSTSLRRIIEEYKPTLCVSSHVHECGGATDEIGETKIVNIGKLSEGRAIIINAPDGSFEKVNIN